VLFHAVAVVLGLVVGVAIAAGVTAAVGETVEIPDSVRQLDRREWGPDWAGTGHHR